MYNEYEDYMRSVLGYPMKQEAYNTYNNVFDNNEYCFPYRNINAYYQNRSTVDEARYESLYPEIYKILKPMVTKICANKRIDEISDSDINRMADEIYANVESDIDVVNINITTQNGVSNVTDNQSQKRY